MAMTKALLRQFCSSNCVHLCAHITLSSISKVNIAEWLASVPAEQKFVDCALTTCLAQLEEITPLMGMNFMYFSKIFRVY